MCKVNHEFYTINLKSIHDPSLNDMVYIIQDVESQNKKSYKEVVLGPFRVESFDTMVSFTTSPYGEHKPFYKTYVKFFNVTNDNREYFAKVFAGNIFRTYEDAKDIVKIRHRGKGVWRKKDI